MHVDQYLSNLDITPADIFNRKKSIYLEFNGGISLRLVAIMHEMPYCTYKRGIDKPATSIFEQPSASNTRTDYNI